MTFLQYSGRGGGAAAAGRGRGGSFHSHQWTGRGRGGGSGRGRGVGNSSSSYRRPRQQQQAQAAAPPSSRTSKKWVRAATLDSTVQQHQQQQQQQEKQVDRKPSDRDAAVYISSGANSLRRSKPAAADGIGGVHAAAAPNAASLEKRQSHAADLSSGLASALQKRVESVSSKVVVPSSTNQYRRPPSWKCPLQPKQPDPHGRSRSGAGVDSSTNEIIKISAETSSRQLHRKIAPNKLVRPYAAKQQHPMAPSTAEQTGGTLTASASASSPNATTTKVSPPRQAVHRKIAPNKLIRPSSAVPKQQQPRATAAGGSHGRAEHNNNKGSTTTATSTASISTTSAILKYSNQAPSSSKPCRKGRRSRPTAAAAASALLPPPKRIKIAVEMEAQGDGDNEPSNNYKDGHEEKTPATTTDGVTSTGGGIPTNDDGDSKTAAAAESGTNSTEGSLSVQPKGKIIVEKLTDFAYRQTNASMGGKTRGRRNHHGGNHSHKNKGLVRVQPDATKTPICPTFLRGDVCTNVTCMKRHDVPVASAMPVCLFFQRQGMCLRENCPFRHVKVNPRATPCPSFSLLGFCNDDTCTMMHQRRPRRGAGAGGMNSKNSTSSSAAAGSIQQQKQP